MSIRNPASGRTRFQDAFRKARDEAMRGGKKTFDFDGAEYTTELRSEKPKASAATSPRAKREAASATAAARAPAAPNNIVAAKRAQKVAEATPTPEVKRKASDTVAAPKPLSGRYSGVSGIGGVDDSPATGASFMSPEEKQRVSKDAVEAVGSLAAGVSGVAGATRAAGKMAAKSAAKKAAAKAERDATMAELRREGDRIRGARLLRPREGDSVDRVVATFGSGGAVKHRGDGIAKRGHTKGRYI